MPEVKPLTPEEIATFREVQVNPFMQRLYATLDERDVEIARLTALVQHLESWHDKSGQRYDLTNPEASVQPLVDDLERITQERDPDDAWQEKVQRRFHAELERRVTEARRQAFRECAEIANRIRRQIELSPGVGADRQAYGIAVCEDIVTHIKCACPKAFEKPEEKS